MRGGYRTPQHTATSRYENEHMKNNRLIKAFFRENPLKPISAATLGHMMITAYLDDDLEKLIGSLADQGIGDDRRQKIKRERAVIEQTDDPAALVELARKGIDLFNRMLLCQKIVERHEEAMPLLLRRYRTCALEPFIDTSMIVFAMADDRYAKELLNLYEQIRSPYAKCSACLIFGVKNMEDILPLLLKEYERFLKDYPMEDYDQYPLLAIYLLFDQV